MTRIKESPLQAPRPPDEEQRLKELELIESKRFLQSTLDALSSHIAILDEYGRIIEVNRAWNRFALENGCLAGKGGVGMDYLQVCDSAEGPDSAEARQAASGIRALLAGQTEDFQLEYPCHSLTEQRWFTLRATRFGGEGPVRVVVAHDNITKRRLAEGTRDRLAAIIEASTDLIGFCDPTGRILFLNRAARDVLGVDPREDITEMFITDVIPNPASHPTVTEGIPTALRQGAWSGDVVLLNRRGEEIFVSQVILAHKTPSGELEFISTIMRDITERRGLEARVFQSQKLETVGKLAGGIAHEFNSILTAIIGQAEMLISDLPATSPLAGNATEIATAAHRAAKLTRQLLAYGRKQILRPEILDLNQVLTGMDNMLHHLMGGNVNTHIIPAPGLRAVKADAGQIEQVIMNMAINAHDAMPKGGRLTLETANASIDQESVGRYPDLKAGEYVTLAITDTGIGMGTEVKARVFEPFFSTKNVGQGAGLGLSTCYGIVKQSGGHITVYSEPARGATFRIYLPQVGRETTNAVQRLDSPELPRGTETILLVEDDPSLREMAATLLRRLGYIVWPAANGIEALGLKQQRGIGHIDLLFTDVVMPHMSGKELSDRVHASSPYTRTLFASAYAENAIVHHGVLDEGVALLQKPFTPAALARKLREVLDQSAGPH